MLTIKKNICCLTIAALTLLTQPNTLAQTLASVAAYDCTAQAQIPSTQCNALKALFASTDGENWTNKSNWGTGLPDTWAGVFIIPATGDVTTVDLDSNNLIGTLPVELGNLTGLRTLQLSHNNLTGPIPTTLTSLTQLRQLFLYNNQLTGGIPDIFAPLTDIELVSIGLNPDLGGTIPTSLASASSLRRLFLNGSGIIGTIPSGFGNLPNLLTLHLHNNELTGAIPDSFGLNPATPQIVDFSNNSLDADALGVALLPTPALQLWGASGSQRSLFDQTATTLPTPASITAVPTTPQWALIAMFFSMLFLSRRYSGKRRV